MEELCYNCPRRHTINYIFVDSMMKCIVAFQAIFNTSFGEEVRVVGNHPILGSWDPNNGLRLVTSKQDYPTWKAPRRITLQQGYRLEFKVCIFQNGHFNRWENFPPDRNRVFVADCSGIRIKILESHLQTHFDKRYRAPSSDEFVAGQFEPPHKFMGMLDSEEDSNSSSGYEQFDEPDEATTRPVHKIMELVNAFRCCLETGIRTNQHPYLKHYVNTTKIPTKKNYQTHTAWHFLPQTLETATNQAHSRTCALDVKGLVLTEALLAQFTRVVFEKITGPCRTKSPAAIIFHGLQFGMMPRYMRGQYGDTTQFSTVVQFQANSRILDVIGSEVQVSDLIQSLFLAECLIFPNYAQLEEFLDLLERHLIQFTVKSVGLHELCIISDFKPFYVKVLTDKQSTNDLSETMQLPVFQSGDQIMHNPDKDILDSYQKNQGIRMLVFSFGPQQNLDLLVKNKEQLGRISKQSLVFVFTPHNLATYTEVVNQFPNIAFISSTYMDIWHRDMRKSLMPDNRRGEKVFPKEFLATVKREAQLIPGVKVRMQNNLLYIRQEEGSVIGMEFFEGYVKQLQALVYHEREANRESLIVTRINTSTVEVRQAYQTKMFLTNLIFKASVSRIGFMALFMLNRFENFKYFKQLRHVLEEQKSLSSKADFFGYMVSPIRTQRPDVLTQEKLSSLLSDLLLASASQMEETISIRKAMRSHRHFDFKLAQK